MKVRLLRNIAGSFQARSEILWDAKRGDVVDFDDVVAMRKIAAGLATANLKGELPPAHAESEESRAAMNHPLLVADRQRNLPPEESRPLPAKHVGRRQMAF